MLSAPKKLFCNARVVCMDEPDTHAEAVLVAQDRIEAVGSEPELRALAPHGLERIDLGGATLYPGFIDTHSHLDLLANWAAYPYCGGTKTLGEALEILADHAKDRPEAPVVMGYGFDDTGVEELRGPSLQEMDSIFGDRPAVLGHVSIHAAFVNSAMLRLMGIDPAREAGDINVICENGRPTGQLTEGLAMSALGRVPAQEAEAFKKGLAAAMRAYNVQGFTSCIGGGLGLNDLAGNVTLRLLGELELAGEMSLRCHLPILSRYYPAAYEAGLLSGPGSPFVRPHGIKIIGDGAIQSYTAALPWGYHDRPDVRPEPIVSQEDMDSRVLAAHCEGQQVVAHGNGYAAIERALLALERAQKICPRDNPHHLLVHCQTASDEQLARMKNAGFEPTFFVLHIWNWGDRHVRRFLGPARAARLDPCGSAARIGLPFSMHADTPVLPQMTMLSIHTAVNRQSSGGAVLGADQRISPLEAMRAYTSYAAGMCLDEKNRGSIEPGKLADFTLLSADPRTVAPEKIRDIAILGVIVGGRRVA